MPKKVARATKRSSKKRPSLKRQKAKVSKRGVATERHSRAPKPVITPEAITDLIRKGRQRGFLTETELLYAFPDLEVYVDQYEHALDEFEKNGIQVVEHSGSILDSKKPEFLEPAHSKKHLPSSFPLLAI